MPRARKQLVCLDETPYYHITSRCVRRAFLCGHDRYTGQSYEHRREWIETRLRVLSSLFSIEVCAYAVMSNHYHLVVRIDTAEPKNWSDDEVLERWTSLFKGPLLVQQYRDGEALTEAELETLRATVSVFRSRLGSLSWFMKCLNEPIARKANTEDRCTGHFWEARFHSQALRSHKALLAAMVYVDLNPVRAHIADSPEGSHFTSIKARIDGNRSRDLRRAIAAMTDAGDLNHFVTPLRSLKPFVGSAQPQPTKGTDGSRFLPLQESEYLSLVDETGRATVQGKRGRIRPELKPILVRLGFGTESWLEEAAVLNARLRRRLRNA